MSTRLHRRAATTAVTLTMAGALGFGVMTPVAHGVAKDSCYDGRCNITVKKNQTIKVNSKKFGFGKVKVTHVNRRSVGFSAKSGGVYLSGSTSPGGNVKLNNLKLWVKSVSGNKAKLGLFPTKG